MLLKDYKPAKERQATSQTNKNILLPDCWFQNIDNRQKKVETEEYKWEIISSSDMCLMLLDARSFKKGEGMLQNHRNVQWKKLYFVRE